MERLTTKEKIKKSLDDIDVKNKIIAALQKERDYYDINEEPGNSRDIRDICDVREHKGKYIAYNHAIEIVNCFFGKVNDINKKEKQSTTIFEKTVQKEKVKSAEIIVRGNKEKPYYEIKYFDLTDNKWHIGYGSYKLEIVFDWIDQCFEILDIEKIANDTKIKIRQGIDNCYMVHKYEHPGYEEDLCAGLRTLNGGGEPCDTCKECCLYYGNQEYE